MDQIGPYEILDTIGSGGMGTVYRARHAESGQIVALKVMRADLADDPVFLRRFEREAAIARSLRSPNIVATLDAGVDDDTPWIAMELVDGEPLASYLRRAGPLPVEEALEITLQVTNGLEVAHEQGVIHRDISPQNILMTKTGVAKIADFGIARSEASTTLTATAAFVGKPAYASPEMLLHGRTDIRGDIYSLGVVLFEMLAGRALFVGPTPIAVMDMHVQQPPPTLAQLGVRVPEYVEDIIARCLEKDPERRYQTPREVAAHINAPGFPSGVSRGSGFRGAPWRILALAWITALLAGLAGTAAVLALIGGNDSGSSLTSPGSATSSSKTPTAVATGSAEEHQDQTISGEPVLLWRFHTGASPKVVDSDDIAYVESEKSVFALERATGSMLWSFEKSDEPDFAFSGFTLVGGIIYTADLSHMYAIDATTGALIWAVPTGGSTLDLVASGDILYGSTREGEVFAVAAADGSEVWRFVTLNDFAKLWGEMDEVLYATDAGDDQRGQTYALEAQSGQVRWYISSPNYASVTLSDGSVYLTSSSGESGALEKLSTTDGSSLWSFETNYSQSAPIIAEGRIFKTSQTFIPGTVGQGHVYALDETGQLIWQHDSEGTSMWGPVVVDRTVYVSNGDYVTNAGGDTVFALDAATGSLRWSSMPGGAVILSSSSQPGLIVAALYLGSESHSLALDAASGEVQWTSNVPLMSIPAVFDGIAVIACEFHVCAIGGDRDYPDGLGPLPLRPELGGGLASYMFPADRDLLRALPESIVMCFANAEEIVGEADRGELVFRLAGPNDLELIPNVAPDSRGGVRLTIDDQVDVPDGEWTLEWNVPDPATQMQIVGQVNFTIGQGGSPVLTGPPCSTPE